MKNHNKFAQSSSIFTDFVIVMPPITHTHILSNTNTHTYFHTHKTHALTLLLSFPLFTYALAP